MIVLTDLEDRKIALDPDDIFIIQERSDYVLIQQRVSDRVVGVDGVVFLKVKGTFSYVMQVIEEDARRRRDLYSAIARDRAMVMQNA